MNESINQLIYIDSAKQVMNCFEQDTLWQTFPVSTGKKGMGEVMGSEQTPRGWFKIYSKIGLDAPVNSVFVSRVPTGEIYSEELAKNNPGRDWILTRILQLDGLEPGRNRGGEVDTLSRYIYIHGTPDSTAMGIPGSHGCIRLRNHDILLLSTWVCLDTMVFIE